MKAARENYFVRFAASAYQLCQQTLPLYWHPKSPRRYTVPQLVACLLLMRRLRLSYRDIEQLLWAMGQVRMVLGLSTVPDHTTLQRAFARLQASVWHLLIQCTADVLVKDGELCVAVVARGGRIVDEARLRRKALVESARLEGVYGQRWKVETVHSVMKRKFGDEIVSRRGVLQRREVLLLAVVYNLHRLWCCFMRQVRVMWFLCSYLCNRALPIHIGTHMGKHITDQRLTPCAESW